MSYIIEVHFYYFSLGGARVQKEHKERRVTGPTIGLRSGALRALSEGGNEPSLLWWGNEDWLFKSFLNAPQLQSQPPAALKRVALVLKPVVTYVWLWNTTQVLW